MAEDTTGQHAGEGKGQRDDKDGAGSSSTPIPVPGSQTAGGPARAPGDESKSAQGGGPPADPPPPPEDAAEPAAASDAEPAAADRPHPYVQSTDALAETLDSLETKLKAVHRELQATTEQLSRRRARESEVGQAVGTYEAAFGGLDDKRRALRDYCASLIPTVEDELGDEARRRIDANRARVDETIDAMDKTVRQHEDELAAAEAEHAAAVTAADAAEAEYRALCSYPDTASTGIVAVDGLRASIQRASGGEQPDHARMYLLLTQMTEALDGIDLLDPGQLESKLYEAGDAWDRAKSDVAEKRDACAVSQRSCDEARLALQSARDGVLDRILAQSASAG